MIQNTLYKLHHVTCHTLSGGIMDCSWLDLGSLDAFYLDPYSHKAVVIELSIDFVREISSLSYTQSKFCELQYKLNSFFKLDATT